MSDSAWIVLSFLSMQISKTLQIRDEMLSLQLTINHRMSRVRLPSKATAFHCTLFQEETIIRCS